MRVFELFALWLATALAFAIYHSGGSLFGGRLPADIICTSSPNPALICPAFQEKLTTAAIVAAISLIVHHGARRAAARNCGVAARVKPSAAWLGASVLLAFGGLFIVGPNADWPAETLGGRGNGRIALAGPAASLIVAVLFFAALSVIILGRVAMPAWFPYFGYVGFRLNAMLGLCSLTPLGRFDGAKVLAWNRAVFAGAAAAALVLTFVLGNEQVLQWLLRVVTSLEG